MAASAASAHNAHNAPYCFTSPHKSFRRFSNSIHDYDIHEVLGRGGFGVVHRAISKFKGSLGLEVAIKMIDKALMKAANMTRRVANEVEIHWQLHHPSILELYNYFEDAKYVYLIMEFCKNGELFKYIHKRPQPLLTEPEARVVLMQLVRGLQYIHSNNILHRDLKLSNMLLTHNYDLKLADFGLATRLDNREDEQKTMCGTPNYISPEVVSRRSYGLETDLWSLGCMIVTILTGTPPFQSAAVKSTLDKASRLEYSLPDHISHDARDLIDKLLRLDPKRRISLSGVMQHPFFDHSRPTLPLSANMNVLSRKSDEPLNADRRNNDIINPSSNQHISQQQGTRAQKHLKSSPPFSTQAAHVPVTKAPTLNTGHSLIEPFSTIRLKPMRQVTKHGQVEILPTRDILLDFVGEQYLMLISGDSETISLYARSANYGDINKRPTKQYTRSSLPNALAKKFRYAARFVELVRAKTPKIVFYSPQAKCILLDNGPVSDFEMAFYNGVRVHTSVSKQIVEIRVPFPTQTRSGAPTPATKSTSNFVVHKLDLSRSDSMAVPSDVLPIFKHAQECLRQCLDIERSSSLDKHTQYPIILKSSHTKHISSSSSCPDSPSNSHANAPLPSLHPSACSNFNKSIPVTDSYRTGDGNTSNNLTSASRGPGKSSTESLRNMNSRTYPRTHDNETIMRAGSAPSVSTLRTLVQHSNTGKAPPTPIDTLHPHSSGTSDPAIHSFCHPNTASANRIVHPNSSTSQTNAHSSASSTIGASDPLPTPLVFLEGIGWCFKQVKGSQTHTRSTQASAHAATSFVVLFCDGARMVVHAGGSQLEYSASTRDELESFTISADLTPNLKTRLGHFASLVKMIQQQQQIPSKGLRI
ncbi:hypothetical protein BASA50_002603 [Batrachochytrium salamandrivorans]|uniref:Polo kinase n=1 Tax=Batrachochytrium salamandrivorans TaxID=1357716 RepID=A0ABQ8FNN3_9FUNG|nr:hypothetical protein BASA50_002603 [Batrachochytrium salamandrivorans]